MTDEATSAVTVDPLDVGDPPRSPPTTANGSPPSGFEENDRLRSDYIRALTLRQLRRPPAVSESAAGDQQEQIPRTLVRYWHDPHDVPEDVRDCLDSWDPLRNEGFDFRMFDDASAGAYVEERYDAEHVAAFERCRHPAMRCDYLRLCFVLAEGGLYVDADDVLRGDGWRSALCGAALKVQALAYDISVGGMLPSSELPRADLSTRNRIFYVNNNPIAAPAGHPVLRRALRRATDRLLGSEMAPEIQSTTGPGNLTAALAAHARLLELTEAPADFELLLDWELTAKPRWELGYRSDARNWRNMDP